MAKVIAVSNQKGGVGKTTTSINLACGLGLAGRKVLLIDLDPQFNATTGVGFEIDQKTKSLYEVFTGANTLKDIIIKDIKQNVDLAPSSLDVAAVDLILLEQKTNQQNVLKEQIDSVRSEYDFIIIDCPPSLGLVNRNGLAASDTILIPIQAEHYAMHGVTQLLRTIRKVKENLNENLSIEGVLVTMFDSRTKLAHDVLEEVNNTFKQSVFKVYIPRNIKISESSIDGLSVFEYDAKGPGAKAYADFVKEVLKNNGY